MKEPEFTSQLMSLNLQAQATSSQHCIASWLPNRYIPRVGHLLSNSPQAPPTSSIFKEIMGKGDNFFRKQSEDCLLFQREVNLIKLKLTLLAHYDWRWKGQGTLKTAIGKKGDLWNLCLKKLLC